VLVFVEGGKPEILEENPRKRNGIGLSQTGPHWWDESAFTSAPSMLVKSSWIADKGEKVNPSRAEINCSYKHDKTTHVVKKKNCD